MELDRTRLLVEREWSSDKSMEGLGRNEAQED